MTNAQHIRRILGGHMLRHEDALGAAKHVEMIYEQGAPFWPAVARTALLAGIAKRLRSG